jgi:hypothetical protein
LTPLALQETAQEQSQEMLAQRETLKSSQKFADTWIKFAVSKHACKVCKRLFSTDAECTAFVQQYERALCASTLIPDSLLLPSAHPCKLLASAQLLHMYTAVDM